jgi:hypothetical protein
VVKVIFADVIPNPPDDVPLIASSSKTRHRTILPMLPIVALEQDLPHQ